jgi:hypothetical protein
MLVQNYATARDACAADGSEEYKKLDGERQRLEGNLSISEQAYRASLDQDPQGRKGKTAASKDAKQAMVAAEKELKEFKNANENIFPSVRNKLHLARKEAEIRYEDFMYFQNYLHRFNQKSLLEKYVEGGPARRTEQIDYQSCGRCLGRKKPSPWLC